MKADDVCLFGPFLQDYAVDDVSCLSCSLSTTPPGEQYSFMTISGIVEP